MRRRRGEKGAAGDGGGVRGGGGRDGRGVLQARSGWHGMAWHGRAGVTPLLCRTLRQLCALAATTHTTHHTPRSPALTVAGGRAWRAGHAARSTSPRAAWPPRRPCTQIRAAAGRPAPPLPKPLPPLLLWLLQRRQGVGWLEARPLRQLLPPHQEEAAPRPLPRQRESVGRGSPARRRLTAAGRGVGRRGKLSAATATQQRLCCRLALANIEAVEINPL